MPSTRMQTRRLARRIDENAPPAQGAALATRARSAAPTASIKPGTALPSSSLPVMKRQNSSQTTSSALLAGTKGSQLTDASKRSALGEVTNAGKAKKTGLGAKEERKPLASRDSAPQVPVRRTRSSVPTVPEKKEAVTKEPTKRKAASAVPQSKLPARSRSTTASTSTNEGPSQARLRERKLNIKNDEVEEVAPVRKKRKTSSPALVEESGDVTDIHDEALYDEDGKEVILSSGRKGTSLRSPKRMSKDHGWTDLDAEDEGDPTMVSEYVIDAFNYMMAIERKTMPSAVYMDKQSELQWPMRRVLMDWMIEVHSKFRLLPETLFIAVNLVDRFLTERIVSLVKFQLVGLTALFVAAKYEEVICPSVDHFLHMTDGGYSKEEILKAERYLLSTLKFDLSYPNPLHFLRRISKADGYDIQTRTVAKYLIEISCVEHKLLAYPPSMLAAAAMFLARFCLDRGEWTPNLVHYSTYSESELLPCAQVMLDYLLDPAFEPETSFYRKYASKKHMKSSVFVYQWAVSRWPESVAGTNPYQGRELAYEFDEI